MSESYPSVTINAGGNRHPTIQPVPLRPGHAHPSLPSSGAEAGRFPVRVPGMVKRSRGRRHPFGSLARRGGRWRARARTGVPRQAGSPAHRQARRRWPPWPRATVGSGGSGWASRALQRARAAARSRGSRSPRYLGPVKRPPWTGRQAVQGHRRRARTADDLDVAARGGSEFAEHVPSAPAAGRGGQTSTRNSSPLAALHGVGLRDLDRGRRLRRGQSRR